MITGISVTGADVGSGELGVVAGSSRANVQPVDLHPVLDLPRIPLPTRTGDVTVHCSCTLHMSRPPVERERRVVYTGFGLARRPGDIVVPVDPAEERRRAGLNDQVRRREREGDVRRDALRAVRCCRRSPDSFMHTFLLVGAAFLASLVEMVEALTIVLAVGVTRGWRSAGAGVAAGVGTLVIIVGGFGPALARLPIDSLRVVVGTLLLVFGVQWLRKAILRAGHLKAMHDEDAIYAAEVAELTDANVRGRHDWYAFTVAFKGVFLEGLEVAFIVVTFGGAAQRRAREPRRRRRLVARARRGFRARPARVPENTLKFGVGVMLTSFGIFWSAEGAGIAWPGKDVSLLGLIVFVIAASSAHVMRRRAMTRHCE